MAVLQLTALLTCAGLATSRIGLVVHELLGHGGATIAVGGTVADVQLFYLAGGWIRFRAEDGHLLIAMGGIAVEAAVALALILGFRRRDGLEGRILRAIGWALLIHASWYLATGTWHGYGDGAQLHRLLGDQRWLVAVPAAIVTCGAAYTGARVVIGPLAQTVPGTPRARIVGTVIAILVAGGIQLGAAVGEVALRRDTTYSSTMKPERERVVARELRQWTEEQRRQGAQPTAQARDEMQRALARRHRTFPFAYVLGVLVVLAIGIGAVRSPATPSHPISARLVAISAAIAGGSIALVIALDAAFL
ncbi:MAG: hypothetical protein JWP01_1679 [Myxococcales bacterium]|nr:hypothetical protein [Myxococcales bacterium]